MVTTWKFIQRLSSAAANYGNILAVNDRMDTILQKLQGLLTWRYSAVANNGAVSGGASSTADINIITTSFPATYYQLGSTFRVTVYGTITKPLSAGTTVNIWLKVGSTKIATLTWTPTAAQTNQPFVATFYVTVRSIAVSGSVFGAGDGVWQMAATTTPVVSAGSTLTVDTTAVLAMTAGFNFSNSNATNNVTANVAMLGQW